MIKHWIGKVGENMIEDDIGGKSWNSKPFESNTYPGTPVYDTVPKTSERSSYPKYAGILLLIAGISAIVTGLIMVVIGYVIPDLWGTIPMESYGYTGYEITPEFIQTIYITCGAVIIIFSIFMFLGGIMSLKRKMWGLALLGSVLGLFSIGILLLSSVLSLIALILLALSKKEFEQSTNNI
jgi:hypothetical protein